MPHQPVENSVLNFEGSKRVWPFWNGRWKSFGLLTLVAFFSSFFGVCSPYFQKTFVDHISEASELSWMVLLYNLGLAFLTGLLFIGFTSVARHYSLIISNSVHREGAKKLYDHSLNLATTHANKVPVGANISVFVSDVPAVSAIVDESMINFLLSFFPLLVAPVALSFIHSIPIGTPVIVCVSSLLACGIMALIQAKTFTRAKSLQEGRLEIVNEWLQNMRSIRICGWTDFCESKIFAARNVETRNRLVQVTLGSTMNSIMQVTPFLINAAGAWALLHANRNSFRVGDLVSLFWIFGVYLIRPLRMLPWVIVTLLDGLSSANKLGAFFSLPTQQKALLPNRTNLVKEAQIPLGQAQLDASSAKESFFEIEPETNGGQSLSNSKEQFKEQFNEQFNEQFKEQDTAELFFVRVHDMILNRPMIGLPLLKSQDETINPSTPFQPLLNIANIAFGEREFVVIAGPVGAGKSLFLKSLLHENWALPLKFDLAGQDAIRTEWELLKKSFAYIPQDAFIMNGTIRQNVEFAFTPSVSDEAIKNALQLAEFEADLSLMPEGLLTEIGERGVNLSGGQKQRICLARAVLQNSKILLLDNAFSALDEPTLKLVLNNLVLNYWKEKLIVLVTHQVSLMEHADRVLFLDNGILVDSGRFESLYSGNDLFRNFIRSKNNAE